MNRDEAQAYLESLGLSPERIDAFMARAEADGLVDVPVTIDDMDRLDPLVAQLLRDCGFTPRS